MFKKIMSSLLLMVLLGAGNSFAQQVTISIPDTVVDAGSDIEVPVMTSDLAAEDGVVSGEWEFTTSSGGMLTVTAASTEGSLLEGTNALYNSTTGRFAFAGTEAITGSGLLLTLTVQVNESASKFQEATIGFRNARLNEGDPSVATESGTVRIRGMSITPKSPSSNIVVGSTFQFDLEGDAVAPVTWSTSDDAIAEINGDGLLSGISSGTVRVYAEDSSGLIDSTSLFRVEPETLLDLTLSVSNANITQTLQDTVSVMITDITGLDIRSGQFDLDFPSNRINILSVLTEGTLFENRPSPITNIDGNRLSVAFADSDPYEGAGELLKLVVQIPRNSTGNATITPQNVLFNESIEANTSSGTITIENAPTPVIEPLQSELTIGETVQFSVTSGGAAPYTWSSSNPGVASIDSETGEMTAVSRGTTDITATDADNFASEESTVLVNDITLSMSDYTMADGGSVTIPLESMDVTGLGIFSYEIEILFDPGVIAFDELQTSGTISDGISASASADQGVLTIAAASASPLAGAGSLVDVVFKRSDSPGSNQQTDLTFQRVQFNEPGPDAPTATRVSGSVSVEGVSWTGGGDGSTWNDPANWSSASVPGSESDVLIGLEPGSNYTISTSDAVTVNSLILSGGNATLQLNETFTTETSLILSGGNVSGSGDLITNGLLTWEAGSLSGSGSVLPQSGLLISGTASKVLDERSLVISADIDATITGRNLSGSNGAEIVIDEEALLSLETDNASGLFSIGSGSATIRNSGEFTKSAGGTSAITVAWDIENSGTVSVNRESASLRFTGSISDNGGIFHSASGTLELSSNGTYSFSDESVISSAPAGTIRFGAVSADSEITLNGTLNSNGTTIVRSSTSSGTATLIIPENANLTSLGGNGVVLGGSSGSLILESSDPITIGSLELRSGGHLTLNSELTVTDSYLQNHQSATIESEYDIFVDGNFTWSGGTMTGSATTFANSGMEIRGNNEAGTKTLDGRTLEVTDGTARYLGDRFFAGNGGRFVIGENATLNFTPFNEITTLSIFDDSSEDPLFLNRGSVISTANNNAATFEWPIENEGSINLGSNSLVIEANAGLSNSGALTGSGNIAGDVENINGGVIQPGTDSDAGLLQFFGTFTQDSESVINIKIAGTTPGSTHDQIRANDFILDGTLSIDLINDYTPDDSALFRVLVWPGGTRTGTFAEFEGLEVDGLNLAIRFADEALEVYDGSFTPSPGSASVSVNVDTPPFQRIGRSVPINATVSNTGGVATLQRVRVENFTYGVTPSTGPNCPTNDAYENLKCRMEQFGVTPPKPEEGSEEEYPFLLQTRFPVAIGSDDSGNGSSEGTEFSSVTSSGGSFGITAEEQCTNEPVNPVVKTGSPVTDDDLSGCAYEIAKLALNLVPGADCFKLAVGITTSIGEGIHSGQFDLPAYLAANMVGALGCAGDAVPASAAINTMRKLNEVVGAAGGIQSAGNACLRSTGGGSSGSASGSSQTTCIGSFDPNDKIGPQGVLDGRYIADGDSLPYVVFFENLDEATAAAQTVIISDTLDTDVIDFDTFSFGMIAWTDTAVSMTPNVPSATRDVDLRPEMDLIVRVEADLDIDTGVIKWVFTSLDPETMEHTLDPLAGFLPPNETSPEGEGLVSYFVSMKEDMPSNTTFGSSARIIFDENDPIDTPVWSNTLDTEPPVSSVEPLESIQTETEFTVSWGGEDDASGIEHYTIYVSEDGGDFTIWQNETNETSALFTGEDGKTYEFFSRSVDWVGNAENLRGEADTQTEIQLATTVEPTAGIPDHFELEQNYPNPFNPTTTIQYGLPESGNVTLEVYDMTGRRVATLVNENQRAGWHDITFDASNLASGMYIYRMQSGDFVNTRKLILVK